MTFVGKILVIVIMAFSLFFLAVSTVVFTTERNWAEEVKKQREQVTKLKNQVNDLNRSLDEQKNALAKTQADAKAQSAALTTRINTLTEENTRRTNERTDIIKQIETAQENMKVAQANSA